VRRTRKSFRCGSRVRPMSADARYALNAVCPYFTMFPLEYPMRALNRTRLTTYRSPIVCDPYCGRGTSLFAARMRGIRAYGMDVAPVAVAIAQAKLATTGAAAVLELFDEIIEDSQTVRVPRGDFWQWCYEERTLHELCRLRRGLFGRRSDAAAMLRAVILGALHGPRAKHTANAAYFSNQMPRTFAAKPEYAVRFWRGRRSKPPRVDVRAIVQRRTERAIRETVPAARTVPADVQCADSRRAAAYARVDGKITHVITSPPYYGLRTYSPDQWLREWFLGGVSYVDYGADPGLDHKSPEAFAKSLGCVWDNVGNHASSRIRLYIRFGGIRSRKTSAEDILRNSFEHSQYSWRILTKHHAATSNGGRRQALQMQTEHDPVEEYDYVAALA
jgi:hypothetical protein